MHRMRHGLGCLLALLAWEMMPPLASYGAFESIGLAQGFVITYKDNSDGNNDNDGKNNENVDRSQGVMSSSTPLPITPNSKATTLLQQAQDLADQALITYRGTEYNIDQLLWQDALEKAETALALEPNNTAVLAFIANVYHTLSWEARTREYWLRYLEAGGPRTDTAISQLTAALTELGFVRYQNEDLPNALAYYQEAHAVDPTNPDALLYLARIYFEQDNAAAALPYWEQAAALNLEGANYFLARAQQRAQVGTTASDAFYLGQEAYQAGNIQAAWQHFATATRANDNFTEGWAWRGRTALETNQPQDALVAWQRVQTLNPQDDRAGYFASIAERQVIWGQDAGQAFTEGITAYEQGDTAAAATAFERATTANPAYLEAWVWQARTLQEANQPQRAVVAWEKVLEQNPQDDRARYFLNLARTQAETQADTSSAQTSANTANVDNTEPANLAIGIRHYEAGDLTAAKAVFQRWTDQHPDASEGWGWLGRIAFDQQDYAAAANYYDTALMRDPTSDTYKFFSEEAHRLQKESP